jgi:hypothetical protein
MNQVASSNDTWTVRLPDGTQIFLGASPRSRQTNARGTCRWFVAEKRTIANRRIVYEYWRHSSGNSEHFVSGPGMRGRGSCPRRSAVLNEPEAAGREAPAGGYGYFGRSTCRFAAGAESR